jgi:hypothetical protein
LAGRQSSFSIQKFADNLLRDGRNNFLVIESHTENHASQIFPVCHHDIVGEFLQANRDLMI